MRNPVVFMYSGQGSQYYQMGRELYEFNSTFCRCMNELDSIFQDITGQSLVDILYGSHRKGEVFKRTLYTHPSIFMVGYSLSQVLKERGITPDYVLGTSLGEYISYAMAGVLNVEELMTITVQQAMLIEDKCQSGEMLTVLTNHDYYHQNTFMNRNSEMVSVNYENHFVVSGGIPNIAEIRDCLNSNNIPFIKLPVSHAFHSALIEPIKVPFEQLLKGKKFKKPQIPLISSLSGQIVDRISSSDFWDVIRQPIHFPEAIRSLDHRKKYMYLDVGPSGTLSNFIKKGINNDAVSLSFSAMTPFQHELKNLDNIISLMPQRKSDQLQNREEVRNMITYVFPGQGSQHKGMGGALFDEYSDLTSEADDILGYSIKELCLEDPQRRLNKTEFTQPALYVVNALSYLKKLKETKQKPTFLAGHSLGEYNALFAAGVFDFGTGLELVKRRGELMSKAPAGGGMAAVIGINREKVRHILISNELTTIDIANFNAPNQIILSGPKKDIDQAARIFEQYGVERYIPLNVSGAFHSRYMREAAISFAHYLDMFEFQAPTIPVVSNVHARIYENSDIKINLIDQISSSVNWMDSIRYLLGKGTTHIEEIGPGRVLTKLVDTIRSETEPLILVEEESKPVERANNAQWKEMKALTLGSEQFKKDYNLRYAYVTGSMYRGIASEQLVIRMGRAGMMGFFGTGGLKLERIEEAIINIQSQLSNGESYGMNLIHTHDNEALEETNVDLFLKYGVRHIEASAYMSVNMPLVRYRAKGLWRDSDGNTIIKNKIIAKVSRPEVAEAFLNPAPERIISRLLELGEITQEEAENLRQVPMADDLCVEADSGGHTDQGVLSVLLPSMIRLRDEVQRQRGYRNKVRVGAAGGIGTPEAAASAFILGADFIVTGSINQCSVEAAISDSVKDMLEQINVQDTGYAPAGDMFEMGSKVQVLKKGVFFPARANKLYELYKQYNSIEEIDPKSRKQLQEKYFKRSFPEIYEEIKTALLKSNSEVIEKAEKDPKYKMSLIFKWYFRYSTRVALDGDESQKVNYQVHCGPALGAFNQWVRGTELERWRNRHVDRIAEHLLNGTADLLNTRIRGMFVNE
ncbi:ACP S-malonyltransferase [Bacillus cereus]|uniref:ACP S-malonyltransferase n=1 Tax=Bacillus cereus group TaxID=86661 RepID=UPI003D003778